MDLVRDLKRTVPLQEVSDVDAQRPPPFLPQLDPIEFARMLWRRKWVMLATAITVMLVAVVGIKSLTPRYTATAFVEINPRQTRIVDFEAVLSGLPADTATMETEIQIIQSRNLAAKTVAKLGLERDPEFNPSLRPRGGFAQWLAGFLPGAEEPAAVAASAPQDGLEGAGGSVLPPPAVAADAAPVEGAPADGAPADAAPAVGQTPEAGQAQAPAATATAAPQEGAQPDAAPALPEEDRGIIASAGHWLASLVMFEQELAATPEQQVREERAHVIDSFLDRLSVKPEGRSRVIAISVESTNPHTAAAAANVLADFYIVAQLEAKFEAAKRASAWLNERIFDLREEVSLAERAVESFRDQSGLIQGTNATLAAEQISELSRQHILERAQLAEAEARLRQLEKLVAEPGGIGTVGEVLNSQLIRDLRRQEAEVERRVAELASQFGERHPRMINARAELSDLRNKVKGEVDKIIQGVRNEVAVVRARAASLNKALNDLKDEVANLNTSEVQLRALEREAAASRSLLEQLLTRSKETSSQEDFQQADATIVSEAAVPEQPSFPKKRILFLLAFVLAGVASIAMAILVERMDAGFRSMDQVERLGATPLGLVPALRGLRTLARSPQDYIVDHPTSAYGEAIRSIHTNLLLSDLSKRPRVILFASALPNEGKTSTVTSLARLQANVGQKVIIVDCDVRRPAVHDALGLPAGPGLVECILGEASLDQVIQKDPRSEAHVIQAGAAPANPPDLFDSIPMQKLLTTLARKYDLVLLDSAPIMAVSDTLFLSRLADKTVMIIRWVQTRRETAKLALSRLLDARGDVAGVLLSIVDAKGHARYSFSDSGSYHGKLTRYYTR